MRSVLNQRLAKYGVWTYRGAWILEITASLIGLGTGLALGYQALAGARNDPGTAISDSEVGMAFVLSSAPFFMVALAELTKIPIATLLFSARWPWKPIVLVFLLLLAGITFETVFMGLERAVTLRQLAYEGITKQISDLRAEDVHLKTSSDEIKNPQQIAQIQGERDKLNADVAQERAAIQKQLSDTEEEIEGRGLLSPEAASIKDKLQTREAAYAALVSERDKRLADEGSQFERQRESFVDRLKGLQQPGDSPARQKVQDQLDKLANPRAFINAKYADRISVAEADIKTIRQNLDDAKAKQPAQTVQHQSDLQTRRTELIKELEQSNINWQQQLDKLNTRLSEAQSQRRDQDQQLHLYESRQAEIQKSLGELEAKRTTQARLDQVRRIASRFYGKSPENVSEDEAGVVSVIWFGSLALLAALAGPFTAMVALGLQRIADQGENERDSKFFRLLRRMLLRWRWKRVRHVFVVKEVSAEKIVYVDKIVEKPIETLVKEIVYVPILTDNPADIREVLDSSIPDDIANLVKFRVIDKSKDAPYASKA